MSHFEPSAAEFRALYDRVKRMSQWGAADRRGALNNISATEVVAAASGVWRGLVAVCEELNRWSFLCVIAPLRLRAATGSPINPIAIF
jgi:hypothetical protein